MPHGPTRAAAFDAPAAAPRIAPVLEVRDLSVRFAVEGGVVHAVNGISYALVAGESLGIVGESGSGKSASALALLGLVPPPGRVTGSVLVEGTDLNGMSPGELRRVRGRRIAMIFQDPTSALNPVLTIGEQLCEGMRVHLGLDRAAARSRAAELLSQVGMADSAGLLDAYPHTLSGGQRQRVAIAMALACQPAVLIADEPTTALDVTRQAQIASLIKRMQVHLGMALVWITHDLGLIARLVDRVAVMYAGQIVEHAPVRAIFKAPRHPYTRGLLRAIPNIEASRVEALESIPGSPPELRASARACPFAPRCAHVVAQCRDANPPLAAVADDHAAACWRWSEL